MKPSEVTDWKDQWRDVKFKESIKIIGVYRGRSAANFRGYSKESNQFYTVFISDFLDMSLNGDVLDSKIEGEFKVMKKGSNFGIRLVNTPKHESIEYPCYPNNPGSPIPDYI